MVDSTQLRLIYLCLETPRGGQATYTHVHEIIQGLERLGWHVELVSTSHGGASSGTSFVRRIADYVVTLLRFFTKLPGVDAIYVRAHPATVAAAVVAELFRKPVFQEINGLPDDILVTYPLFRKLSGLLDWSYRTQMRLASHVITVTTGLKHWAIDASGHQRVSVIPNGANTTIFSPHGARPRPQRNYVVFVGGLTPWHGISVMVAAVRSLLWPKGIDLVIIGDGIERDLVREASSEGLVTWLGRLPQDEAAAWLRGALCALSITQDTAGHLGTGVAPLKLFEAMASGVPVVVTDLPFQADMVRSLDAGLVVAMDAPDALASAVAELASTPQRVEAMGRNGVAYVEREASWQARALQTHRIIESSMGR